MLDRHRAAWIKSALAVLLLHAVVGAGFDALRRAPGPDRLASAPVNVRTIGMTPPPAAAPVPDPEPTAAAALVANAVAATRRPADAPRPASPAPRGRATPAPRATALDAPPAADTNPGAAPVAAAAALPPSNEPAPGQAAPIYATLIPPSATLSYRLRRGTLHGQAELEWRHLGDRYQVQLQASVAGVPLFIQASEGRFDDAGLAPERFTDQRARRGARAITFQRDADRVTFSAVQNEVNLSPGLQDRLSWIAQLAAVASANPGRLAEGGEIVLGLVGLRGEAVLWRFVSIRAEGDATGLRPIHLRRMPASAYDTEVNVWLDAEPPHWPLRAHWRNGAADPGLELWRAEGPATR